MYQKNIFQTYNDFEEFHEFSYIHNQIFQDITSEVEEQRREVALNLAKELSMLKQKVDYQVKLTVEELISFGRYPYSQGEIIN